MHKAESASLYPSCQRHLKPPLPEGYPYAEGDGTDYFRDQKCQEKIEQAGKGILMDLLDTDTIIFGLKGNSAVEKKPTTASL